jgi:putative SOS response-associated peptidase YedK
MCSRVRLSSDVSEIKLVFSIPAYRPTPNIAPSWNIAPTDPLPVIRYEGKHAFREAFQRRRCLVPVDNFFEWKKVASGKQPYAIALADRGLMALAGLWENWRSPAGEWVRSFTIITTTPNDLCAELHNRMPVVLGRQVWPEWLGEEPVDLSRLKALLAPYPSEEMICWPVSARVGNVKNNDPSLIEPITGGP